MHKNIEDFLQNHQITQKEYSILFEDKSDWYIKNKDYSLKLKKDKVSCKELFELSLIKIINLHSQYKEIQLYDIHFPSFDISFYSNTNILNKNLTFVNCVFYENTSFKSSTIKNDIY